MSQSKPTHRRRQILIDREFQLGFITRIAGFLVFYLMVFLVVSVVGPVAFALFTENAEWALMEISFRVEVLLRLVLAPIACTFVCLFAHGVIETFRIAGPNYRFKAVMHDLARFRIPRGVKIRKNDYLQDTAKDFHQALVRIHERVAELKVQSDAAVRAVQDGNGTDTPVAEHVQEMHRLLEEFELVGQAPGCAPLNAGETPVEPVSDEEPEPQLVS